MSDILEKKTLFEKNYEYGYGAKGDSDTDNDGKKEIDCSHLVNKMVCNAGYDIPYQTTEQLNKSSYYDVIDPSDAKSGDILLWRGKFNHTGVLDSISYSASPSRFSGSFFGSQSSSGPATAKFGDGAPYWPRPTKILRPKEKYKTEHVGSSQTSGNQSSCVTSCCFPVVTEKGEPYKDADAVYQLLEKETSGFYLLSAYNFWHGGIHFTNASVPHHVKDQPLRCMMDGKVIAYRLNKDYLSSDWLGQPLQYSS
jgi:NlpC/P60 family.